MKIWIKLFVGAIVGVVLGLVIPQTAQGVLDSISSLMIGIGRYAVFPLVFFSLGIGTTELKQEHRLLRVYLSGFKYLVLSAAVLVLIGTLSVLVFPPERIPVTGEVATALQPVSVTAGLAAIFPRNLFTVLVPNGEFLLPIIVLAFLLGVNMDFDRQLTRPVAGLFDALSRIFYHLNSLLVEFFGFAMIAIMAALMMRVSHSDLGMYKQILIILTVDVLVVALGAFPAGLYFLGIRDNPYRWLYAGLGPALAGLFTGDQYVSLGILSKHGKETFGVPRMIGSGIYPLFASLGRAGTAMVSSVAFVLILKSYSGLDLTLLQVLWVMFFSFLVSFIMGAVPGSGAFFAVFMLCNLYGRGLQEGYLILKTVAPLLVSFGAFIDVLTSAFASLLIAREENLWVEVDTENFI